MKSVTVIITPHFLTQLYTRTDAGFPSRKFLSLLPSFFKIGKHFLDQDCMGTAGNAKIVFRVQPNKYIPDNFQLVFITVMPKEYKHNVFNKVKTTMVGEISAVDLQNGGYSEEMVESEEV